MIKLPILTVAVFSANCFAAMSLSDASKNPDDVATPVVIRSSSQSKVWNTYNNAENIKNTNELDYCQGEGDTKYGLIRITDSPRGFTSSSRTVVGSGTGQGTYTIFTHVTEYVGGSDLNGGCYLKLTVRHRFGSKEEVYVDKSSNRSKCFIRASVDESDNGYDIMTLEGGAGGYCQ